MKNVRLKFCDTGEPISFLFEGANMSLKMLKKVSYSISIFLILCNKYTACNMYLSLKQKFMKS